MSQQIVFLEQKFMFDPSETFAHLFEFDQALSKAFEAMGMEVEIIRGVDGMSSARVFFIKKKPDLPPPAPPKIQKKLTKPTV